MPRRRVRLDQLLAEKGLAPSRARAQALIMSAKVRADGQLVTKAGTQVDPAIEIELIEPDHPYVSRGALKLEAALDRFAIDPTGLVCLDIGASTGGFTDLLLQRGAARVLAVDVGRGQLDWRLRTDRRVVVMEGVNARHLEVDAIADRVDLVTIDVSFISLRLVAPAALQLLEPSGWMICLVKPQFEAGRELVGKGGVVRDEEIRRQVIDDVVQRLCEMGLELVGLVPSPIRGPRGNLEELAVFRPSSAPSSRPSVASRSEEMR